MKDEAKIQKEFKEPSGFKFKLISGTSSGIYGKEKWMHYLVFAYDKELEKETHKLRLSCKYGIDISKELIREVNKFGTNGNGNRWEKLELQ